MKIIQLLLLSFFLSACNSSKDEEIIPSELFQHWKHSYEEQITQGQEAVYRPASFISFPPSRFRMQYSFKPDGSCQYLKLSPYDAHTMEPCRYTYNNRIIQIFELGEEGKLIKTLSVVTILRNRLVLNEQTRKN